MGAARDGGGRVVNHLTSAHGHAVQAGVVHGGVHFHSGAGPPPVARPVAEWTARDLGVHASIVVGDGEPADLPRYVVRRHDEVVRALVGGCAVESRMVVLVGGSAVGKTRTAYEALLARDEVRSWPVIAPDGPAQLRALLADGVPARHVLWLNDLGSRFLGHVHGADLAEGLTSAVRGGGLVLVLADLWTSHLRALTSASPHVEHLLGLPRVELVTVPDDFTGADETERARLRDCAGHDGRLALAVNLARADQKITQLLAGGPQLLRHYTEGGYTDQAHALITAALDATHLGCRAPVDVEVLRHAAADYLAPSQRVVADDWFTEALADAAGLRHGVAAVTPIRTRPGMGAADSCVPHDYLLHETSGSRDRARPPAGLWTALAQRPPGPEDCGRLAAAAVRRGLYRLAAHFARPAAEAGNPSAAGILEALCEWRGAEAQAEAWRRTIPEGPRWAGTDLFDLLHGLEENTPSEPEDRAPSRPLAGESLALLRERTAAGDPLALLYLVKRLGDTGADQEAERLLRLHANDGDGAPGDPSAMWALGDWLARRDRVPEAIRWYALSAERSLQGANLLVEMFSELGCPEAAEAPLRAQHARHGGLAGKRLAELLGLLDRHDEAVEVLRELVEEDSGGHLPGRTHAPLSLSRLSQALRNAGRAEEAARVQAYGIEPGGATASPWELPVPR